MAESVTRRYALRVTLHLQRERGRSFDSGDEYVSFLTSSPHDMEFTVSTFGSPLSISWLIMRGLLINGRAADSH